MQVAIIGCGRMGERRAKHLKHCTLKACVDSDLEKARILAQKFPSCLFSDNWQEVISRSDINIVIVSTPHASLAEISHFAVSSKKHIFIEKPAGRRSNELIPLIDLVKKNSVVARVGFNHRYHRSFLKAKELIDQNELGELMFIRARYGHGGRLGYDKEWRAQPHLSGGGELIDQGVHLIDLARWFLGEFVEIDGSAHTFYWDMPVDDNGFLLLKTATKQIAFLHVSCTEWKNTFSFEIYGRSGKIEINGLGGSYGVERISFYKMSSQMGPPETFIWEYPMEDNSWEIEFEEFLKDIELKREPYPGLYDAQSALKIIEEIYRKSNYDYCT